MAQNPDRLQGGYADTLQVGERCYTYFPVSRIAGADRLPYSLTVLLENVLRNAASDEEARSWLSASSRRGARERLEARSSSPRRACCSRTSLAFRCSSTSP